MERILVPTTPECPSVCLAALRLEPFPPAHAELVASWILDEREARWLAPQTPPPLTADRIRAWQLPGHDPLQFVAPGLPTPVAYGELNLLNARASHYWLGHLIVSPAHRGQGIGRALARALLRRAFWHRGAARVSLVVFPENAAAIACYRAAGMVVTGHELHTLPSHRRPVALLRLTTTAAP